MNKLFTNVQIALFRTLARTFGRMIMRMTAMPEPVPAKAVRPQARNGTTIDGEYRRIPETSRREGGWS